MNTFLKVALICVAVLVTIKLLPILMLPVVLGAVVLLAVGALLLGGLAATAGVSLAAILALLGLAFVLLTALSPIWIPVLAIVGLIALIRRGTRTKA